MKKKLVIIQCVKKKIWDIDKSAKKFVEAKNAYVSPYFKKMKKYAENIERADELLVFSAEFGLISLDYKICCYNTTYNKPEPIPLSKEKMIKRVKSQIINEGSHKSEFKKVSEINQGKQDEINYCADFDEIIILGGKKYVEKIKEPLKNLNPNTSTPFQDNNLQGIGHILRWLNNKINHEK